MQTVMEKSGVFPVFAVGLAFYIRCMQTSTDDKTADKTSDKPSTKDNYSWLSAGLWTGKGWLCALIILQLLTIGVYLLTHDRRNYGYEYVSLNADQVKAFNNLVNIYPDESPATYLLGANVYKCPLDSGAADTAAKYCRIKRMRDRRAGMIENFLQATLKGDVSENAGAKMRPANPSILGDQLKGIDSILKELNTRDVTNFVLGYKFKVDSYFWLAGNSMYWEAIFWSLFGVFTSLIYYVSLANQLLLKNKIDDDIGPFDTSEISAQVAKMFYAPAVTLVVLLGYTLLTGRQALGVDVSANHGVMIFSFVAGFYSGRLMKLLDNLKSAIFPASSDGSSTAQDAKAGAGGDITVKVGLADSMNANPAAAAITQAGFANADVTLEPKAGGGQPITLDKPAADKKDTFTASKVPWGQYTLRAAMSFKNGNDTINLIASQDIEVAEGKLSFAAGLAKKDN
jgi:hypothetical protein